MVFWFRQVVLYDLKTMKYESVQRPASGPEPKRRSVSVSHRGGWAFWRFDLQEYCGFPLVALRSGKKSANSGAKTPICVIQDNSDGGWTDVL